MFAQMKVRKNNWFRDTYNTEMNANEWALCVVIHEHTLS
jgi:hypothetical protein